MNTEPENKQTTEQQVPGDTAIQGDMQQSTSLGAMRMHLQLQSPVLQRTYSAVLERLTGCEAVLESPATANVILTDDVARAASFLKDGFTVLQLIGPGFGKRAEALEQSPEYAGRFFVAEGTELISVLSVLQRIAPSLDTISNASDFSERAAYAALFISSRRDERILVVDDSSINREAAQVQYASQNSLSVVDSYKQAVDALLTQKFDVVLLDLLMPPESFMLSDTAFARVAGSEFPAGVFVALLAAKRGCKEIFVVTDASHHDHPAVALLDYFWREQLPVGNNSAITFCKASTVVGPRPETGMKDWVRSTEV